MAYHLVYDVARAGLGTGFFLIMGWGSMMMAIGVWLIRRPSITGPLFEGKIGLDPGQGPLLGRIFAWTFFLMALGITAEVGGSLALRHVALADVSRRNACKTVEGSVANFVPMPETAQGSEHFTVLGVPFAYSDTDFSGGGYNTTGGAIHDGLRVRLCYVTHTNDSNVIVRLETAPNRAPGRY